MTNLLNPTLVPRLTLRIGVTGHRPNKLTGKEQSQVAASAQRILSELSLAADNCREANQDVLAEEVPDLRLVTSLSEGADTIIAQKAREQGYRFDVILPFPHKVYAQKQNFSPEALTTFESFVFDSKLHSLLELDGDPNEKISTDLGYLAAGRRVVAHSDILIAVWNGKNEDGLGGTAQILREAVENGVPSIWLLPSGNACLIANLNELEKFDQENAILTPRGMRNEQLSTLVGEYLNAPKIGQEAHKRLRRFMSEPIRASSSWFAYSLLQWIIVGGSFQFRLNLSVDPVIEEAWSRFRNRAYKIGGKNFSNTLHQKIELRWRHADNVAMHCSHAYRSTYVMNFILAGVAVLAGLLSVFWWAAENSVTIKAAWVAVEVLFLFVILWLTKRGGPKKENWHVRWLEARSSAELLRLARLPLLIGSTAAPQNRSMNDDDDSWVHWYVRATLREIGPPTGRLNVSALRTAITSSIEDETDGQIEYNKRAEITYRDMDHKLHIRGEQLFKMAFFVGLTYLFLAFLYQLNLSLHLFHLPDYQKDIVKSLVTILGAGLPAVGATLFGIRAIGDFKLASNQARRTLRELKELKIQLAKNQIAPNREQTSNLFSCLVQTLTSDIHDWAKIFHNRKLDLPA